MSDTKLPLVDTLYYDGLCPLCQREIRILKRIQRGGLAFVDIHQIPPSAEIPLRSALLQTLHLRTYTGEWRIGVEATVGAWSHTHWGWLFRPLLWPWLAPFSRRIYRRWAEKRYRRLYACSACMGGED
jgi:predicted DCC family thiol-disulfide oxidoreductase YuxK